MVRFLKNFLRSKLSDKTILWWHKLKAVVASCYYRFPANKLKVVGVTGTNGKTTTCHLITAILEEAGFKVAMITTTTIRINGQSQVNKLKMTTPDPFLLQRIIREVVDRGCQYLVLETSSHALSQHRVWGVAFDLAVMTNLTREHLDYHRTFKEYQRAKLGLFTNLVKLARKPTIPKVAILNRDDRSFQDFSQVKVDRTFSYGVLHGDIVANSLAYHERGTEFLVETPVGKERIKINLPGRFNVYNTLAAISTGLALGVKLKVIATGLKKIGGVPGRMEVIEEGQDFKVIVDYAHTPDGLNQVLETLRPTLTGRLIVVVGAEGRRSKTKRPLLGALCGRYADFVIVTNVDPRDEDPAEIINQVAIGVNRGTPAGQKKKLGQNLFKIKNRRQAIKKAFDLARPQDTTLLLAKGAEQTMELKEKIIPWDDRRVARELLRARLKVG
jgi:UDP-N-acetylmuramoyl-L-alanyl-D-glutamate--2,6-diaminopimelate ligase